MKKDNTAMEINSNPAWIKSRRAQKLEQEPKPKEIAELKKDNTAMEIESSPPWIKSRHAQKREQEQQKINADLMDETQDNTFNASPQTSSEAWQGRLLTGETPIKPNLSTKIDDDSNQSSDEEDPTYQKR